jgi:hypothetical protein
MAIGPLSRVHARALCAALAAGLIAAAGAAAGSPTVDPSVPANHEGDPVILTGADFPGWADPANQTVKAPGTDLKDCHPTVEPNGTDPNRWLKSAPDCAHNGYAQPEVDTGNPVKNGKPVDRMLGYRWNATAQRFEQIPFQVDKMFTRYLDNSASGFAVYSGQDQHTTYQFDREGFRYRKEDPSDPCHALADSPAATDPVTGLDTNDELVFMARDASAQAPADATLPAGIESVREVRVSDPSNPSATPAYAYVMVAKPDGPKPAFDATNGYVKYTRDANADTFFFSQSNYDSYGNAPKGHFMWDGKCVGATPDQVKADPKLCTYKDGKGDLKPVQDPGQANQYGDTQAFFKCPQRHRPGDAATIQTPRYTFRYDGRWLLTGLQISPDGGQTYGPNIIDRWKARAFAQDPYSKTPCCGYEDEDKNWGGSSNLMGERVGPVRAIRETWGADSGTNVVRRETFYRDGMRQKSYLRVHVIPALDGIYAQWDFRAGRVNRYYNPRVPAGVPVDGQNDEVLGNLDDPCTAAWDGNGRSAFDQTYRDMYKQLQMCTPPCDPAFGSGQCLPLNRYHQSVDVTDPTLSNMNAALDWNEIAGPHGTVVDRYQVDRVTDLTPGGTPQMVFAMPYYRDDSCFDDGTGGDPGPRLIPRSDAEPRTYTAPDGTKHPRVCWKPSDGDPGGSPKFFQGDIGTHGLHLLMIAESDNARMTVPVDEIDSEQRLAFLPGDQGNVGEQYGRTFEKPLVATTSDYTGKQPAGATLPASGGGTAPPPSQSGSQPPSSAGSNGGMAEGSGTQTPRGSIAVRSERRSSAPRACLPRGLRVSQRGIGRARVGQSAPALMKLLGRPTAVSNSAYQWCVTGGGKLVAVFGPKGRARLVATTAGASVSAARRVRSPRIIRGRRGRSSYVAVVELDLARRPSDLRRYLSAIQL